MSLIQKRGQNQRCQQKIREARTLAAAVEQPAPERKYDEGNGQ